MSLLSFIKKELLAMPRILFENRAETVIILTATLMMVLEYYYIVWNDWFTNLLFFGIVPLLVIVLVLRRNPLDFGLGIGKPKLWIFHTVVFCLIAWLTLHLVSTNPELLNYYDKGNFSLPVYFFTTFATLIGSEFLFRGFLLFGLKDKLGAGTIFVQTIPFVLVHLGKPDIETLSTLLTGIYFGYICYRGGSFWPAFIVHMFINVFFVAVVNM